MGSAERITVTLSTELLEEIDRVEPDRTRFIAEAVEHELGRRRRETLLQSVASPHPETTEFQDATLIDWVKELPDDDDLVDLSSGTAVRWVEGQGWLKDPA